MTKRLLILFFILFSGFIHSQSFTSIWNTVNTSTGSSANNEVTIPTNPAYTTYNYTVDWGDGNSDTGVNGNITHIYATPGTYTIEINGVFPSIYFNETGDRNKIIEITSWGGIQWQTMENAFFGCENLNFDAIAEPDLSQVTSLKNMFRECISFNGILNNWNVSTVTDISGMFAFAEIFNRPLDLWNTINVTDMSWTFHRARRFNEPLDNWNTSSVVSMERMFSEASSFNQNINNWDVSQVTNMAGTFRYAGSYNHPLNNWIVTNVTNMSGMFQGSDFNFPISNWIVENVTNMSAMFRESEFNQPIETWNVSNVTDMSEMFMRHRTFNHPLNDWDVSNVTNMASMFDGWIWESLYNQPLDEWDVTNVTDMNYMFRDNTDFNQDISGWDVINVTNMRGMFENAPNFNQDISNWDVDNVTNMASMFRETDLFNQPLDTWNVINVTDMSYMFYLSQVFNQPLNSWDVDNVTNMSNMFGQNQVFDQVLTDWNIANVTNMGGMFQNANAFNQNLATWNVSSITNMGNMLSNSGLSQENYDNSLIGWAAQTVNSNVNLGANTLNYCDGRIARQELIDNSGWNITGDIINCSFVLCTNLVSPLDGDTNVPASANLVWEATPGATGYKVTVKILRGGTESTPFDSYDVPGGNTVALNLEDLSGNDLLQPGDEVSVLIVPYNTSDGDAVGCTEETFTVVSSWVNSPDAFKLTYDTSVTDNDTTNANQLKIETNTGWPDYLTYDFSIDWGDDQFDNNVTGDITHTYLSPGTYTISIIGNFPAPYHDYSNTDNIKLTSIDQWGTQIWQSMERAFNGCRNMEYNAVDIPNLSAVTSMSNMFGSCQIFNGAINAWDVSNVQNMSYMFAGATVYSQPLDNWIVSNVENMSGMFFRADAFNQPIGNWNTSKVQNMSRMFEDTDIFNQSLNLWDVREVTTMKDMFKGAIAFNGAIEDWEVEKVIDMESMFENAETFNVPIGSWDVANVTNMISMFEDAELFNQPLNDWNVEKVTNMFAMFDNAATFNHPLNLWDVGLVTNMSRMFQQAISFDQNIDDWDVTNVINMSSMFNRASIYNQPLNSWDVNSVVDMSSMFLSAIEFNQALDNWDVSAVANMSSMFQDASVFNQSLNSWDVTSVTLMPSMFEQATAFNGEIGVWNVASVTNMQEMFKTATAFDQPIANWDTGEVLTMTEMFHGATLFNQPIDTWNTSFVTSMLGMFEDAITFDQPLSSWNVASVTTMETMFKNAAAFNQDINSWNVRGVSTMEEMFSGASTFNQSVNNWRVSGVGNMEAMFENASAYNQAMNQWDLGTVTMESAFYNASSFNQYLGDWNVEGVTNMTDMLDNTALIRENYDNTLISWSEQTLTSGLTLGAEGLPYCDALEERQSIIDTYGWAITNDILDCPVPECTVLTSPLNGALDQPLNTNLNWEQTLFARGYRLTVGTTSGGNDIVDDETVTDTSYEFANDFNSGDTVYVTIIPFNDEGDAVVPCAEESFTILGTTATIPDCTSLTQPLNSATDIVINTDISWSPIANADGYRLTVGTSTGASDIMNNVNVNNVTTFDLANDLPENTEIFVTVTPYNDVGDAVGCLEERFTTEIIPVPPSCTTLSSPINGTTGVPIDTDITWNAVNDAEGYLVLVGTTQGGIEVANSIDVGTNTTYTFPTLLQQNRTHYVTIIPYNGVGDATGCLEESFRTGSSTLTDPPACTTLSMPLADSSDVALNTNIVWNAAANTTGYRITVGSSSGANDLFSGDVGDVTTLDLTDDLPEKTEIFVLVTPYNTNGDATACVEESFTTINTIAVPDCTTISSPLNNETDVSISANITWNAAIGATGYTLLIGTTTGGSELFTGDVGNTLTYDPTVDFEENTTIFVTVIPYNLDGNAVGCTEEQFTTENVIDLPSCTTLSSPLNTETDVSVSASMNWNAVTNATGYRLNVGTSSGMSDIFSGDMGNVLTYTPIGNFEENATIYVTITPYNTDGDAIGCAEESFTTENIIDLPNCTILNAPTNGEQNVSVSSNISWNAATGANGYRLSIGSSPGLSDIFIGDVGNTLTYEPTSDFIDNTLVFVTVVPYNDDGAATGCTEESFSTENIINLPDCTSLSNPLADALDVPIGSSITWNTANGATGYRLTIGTSSGGTEIFTGDVGDVLSFSPSSVFQENTILFVNIVPYNEDGDALGCTEESFMTENIITLPDCTTLSSPSANDMSAPLATSISWNEAENATGYNVTIGTSSGGSEIFFGDLGDVLTYVPNQDFTENTTVFVTVIPYNDDGSALGCSEERFTTETLPDLTQYGFSPNGDNINDYWVIDGIEESPDNIVSIYNRWGDMVFQVQGYNNGSNAFDGTANEKTKMGANELPSGTYFFNIEVTGQHSLKKLQGYLVIKR